MLLLIGYFRHQILVIYVTDRNNLKISHIINIFSRSGGLLMIAVRFFHFSADSEKSDKFPSEL